MPVPFGNRNIRSKKRCVSPSRVILKKKSRKVKIAIHVRNKNFPFRTFIGIFQQLKRCLQQEIKFSCLRQYRPVVLDRGDVQ